MNLSFIKEIKLSVKLSSDIISGFYLFEKEDGFAMDLNDVIGN